MQIIYNQLKVAFDFFSKQVLHTEFKNPVVSGSKTVEVIRTSRIQGTILGIFDSG